MGGTSTCLRVSIHSLPWSGKSVAAPHMPITYRRYAPDCLPSEQPGPVGDDRDGRGGRLLNKRVHEKAVSFGGHVVRDAVDLVAHPQLEQRLHGAHLEGRSAAVHRCCHQASVERYIEQLLVIASPPRRSSATRGHLPFAARPGKWRDVHFIPPGLV